MHSPAHLGLPQTGLNHPASQRLGAVAEPVIACQVLACQLRAKVRVMPAHQGHEVFVLLSPNAPVARLTAFARDQPRRPLLPHLPAQALDLAHREAQRRCRLHLAQFARANSLHHGQPLCFLLTHQSPFLSQDAFPCSICKGTLLLGAKGTLLSWGHKK